MMNRLKNDRMALVSTVSALFGLLAVVMYGVLSTDGERSSSLVYALLVIGILVHLMPLMLPSLSLRDLAVTAAGWLGSLLYATALSLFISERVQWLYALLSKMEAAPLTAVFPLTIAIFVLAIVVSLAALYCCNEEAA